MRPATGNGIIVPHINIGVRSIVGVAGSIVGVAAKVPNGPAGQVSWPQLLGQSELMWKTRLDYNRRPGLVRICPRPAFLALGAAGEI